MKAGYCNFLILLKILSIFQELVVYVIPMILVILMSLIGDRDSRKRFG